MSSEKAASNKLHNDEIADISSDSSSPTNEDMKQTFDEIFSILNVTIKNLLKQTDYTSKEAFNNLKLVQKQTRYADDILLHRHVVDKIVLSGIGHVFLRSWQQLAAEDYLEDLENNTVNRNYGFEAPLCQNHKTNDCCQKPIDDANNKKEENCLVEKNNTKENENSDEGNGDNDDDDDDESGNNRKEVIFRSLQYILSIVWNCTDSSVQLCESLVRSSAIYQMLLELSKPKLVDVKYYHLEEDNCDSPTHKRVYLMKAYLGILHNIARHCPESRKMFRSAGALRHLASLVRFPNEVIRAKTYLTLSYIVSSEGEDQELIEAADDIAAFIVALLREALGSVNHFVVRYAFWASEIACGINHLAINDTNKVRLGKLGIIQLYAAMLVNGDDEEKSLASSGIWILSFHPENKKIIASDLTLIRTLSHVANSSSTIESISRSLRGALWVISCTPGVYFTGGGSDDDDDDPSQEHVMISYHWSCQKTMIRVRDSLYARGYKVWFDVDNMRGSTLEAMALAVERSAVIIICMSQSYKESPNCRTEAEYAFRLRKDIVPIIAQSNFNPDGWLGMLAGTRLYFDFSPATLTAVSAADSMATSFTSNSSLGEGESGDLFNFQMDRLVREIGARGKKKKSKSETDREVGIFPGFSQGVTGDSHSGRDRRSQSDEAFRSGTVEEKIITKTQQMSLQANTNDSLSFPSATPLTVAAVDAAAKARFDSGISSAEVASAIINQGTPRCQKCGAMSLSEPLPKFPTFSISSSTPEYEAVCQTFAMMNDEVS